MADAIAKKLDMSLEQIVDERKLEAAASDLSFRDASVSPRGFSGGKFRNTCVVTTLTPCAPLASRSLVVLNIDNTLYVHPLLLSVDAQTASRTRRRTRRVAHVSTRHTTVRF